MDKIREGEVFCELAFDLDRQCELCGKQYTVFHRIYGAPAISTFGEALSNVFSGQGPSTHSITQDEVVAALAKERFREQAKLESTPPIQRCTHCGRYGRSDLALIKQRYDVYRERFKDSGCASVGIGLFTILAAVCYMVCATAIMVSSSFVGAGWPLLLGILFTLGAAGLLLRSPLSKEDYCLQVEKANDPELVTDWLEQWSVTGIQALERLERESDPAGRKVYYYVLENALHWMDPLLWKLVDVRSETGFVLEKPN